MSNAAIGKHYNIVRRLAVGGMGEVLLASTEGDPRTGLSPGLVVVKRTLPKHPNREHQNAMLREEGRVSLRLRHANIIETFGMDVAEEAPIVVMEYLAGRSMAQVLGAAKRNQEMVPVDVALKVLHDAACGLHFAHTLRDGSRELGLVHRDVSPANIIVTFDGRVKVIDFGVAKADDSEIRTSTGVLKGKIGYMAPEHSKGEKLDPRADLWSLGVLTWECLVADRLFSHRNPALTLSRINDGPIPRPSERREDIPASVDDLVMTLLTRPLENRFQSGADVVRAIEAIHDVNWRFADIVGFLKERFPADFAKGTEEVKSAASISGDPAPTGLVEIANMSEEEVEAATIVADRRDLLSLARSMVDLSDENSAEAPEDDLRTVQMSSEDVARLFGSDAEGAPLSSPAAALVDELGDELSDRTVPLLDPSMRPSAAEIADGREGNDAALGPDAGLALPPDTGHTTQPAKPSNRDAGELQNAGKGLRAPTLGAGSGENKIRRRRRRSASSMAVAAATFGGFALVVGLAISFLLPVSRGTQLVCSIADGNSHTVIACIDRPADARSIERVDTAAPEVNLADGTRQRIDAKHFATALETAGVSQRALLPYTTKERRKAGFGPLILWLGLLALGFAIPALVFRGVGSLILRLVLMTGALGLLYVFAMQGILTWPGFETMKPQPNLRIDTATLTTGPNAQAEK